MSVLGRCPPRIWCTLWTLINHSHSVISIFYFDIRLAYVAQSSCDNGGYRRQSINQSPVSQSVSQPITNTPIISSWSTIGTLKTYEELTNQWALYQSIRVADTIDRLSETSVLVFLIGLLSQYLILIPVCEQDRPQASYRNHIQLNHWQMVSLVPDQSIPSMLLNGWSEQHVLIDSHVIVWLIVWLFCYSLWSWIGQLNTYNVRRLRYQAT